MSISAPDVLGRFRGALVGTAVGDALGAPVEGEALGDGQHAAGVRRGP